MMVVTGGMEWLSSWSILQEADSWCAPAEQAHPAAWLMSLMSNLDPGPQLP